MKVMGAGEWAIPFALPSCLNDNQEYFPYSPPEEFYAVIIFHSRSSARTLPTLFRRLSACENGQMVRFLHVIPVREEGTPPEGVSPSHKVLIDEDRWVFRAYTGSSSVSSPITFVVSPEGIILRVYPGMSSSDHAEELRCFLKNISVVGVGSHNR